MPPWTIVPNIQKARGSLNWNFVDGGYVDNSGATTALDLYKLISQMAQQELLNIDLRLVLLTDAEVEVDYKRINGSSSDDMLAPVVALLNVRSQLSQRAVTQAIEHVTQRRGRVELRSIEAPDPGILIIDVEQQTFRLPLGWKISRLTNNIVRLMMGDPRLCPLQPRTAALDSEINGVVGAIEQNSCVKLRMVDMLKGRQRQQAQAN